MQKSSARGPRAFIGSFGDSVFSKAKVKVGGSEAGSRRGCPASGIVPCGLGGWTLRPAACCSAARPMGARLALSPGPMRAAGFGLAPRVGLFNLRGGQQAAAPSAPDRWMLATGAAPPRPDHPDEVIDSAKARRRSAPVGRSPR